MGCSCTDFSNRRRSVITALIVRRPSRLPYVFFPHDSGFFSFDPPPPFCWDGGGLLNLRHRKNINGTLGLRKRGFRRMRLQSSTLPLWGGSSRRMQRLHRLVAEGGGWQDRYQRPEKGEGDLCVDIYN